MGEEKEAARQGYILPSRTKTREKIRKVIFKELPDLSPKKKGKFLRIVFEELDELALNVTSSGATKKEEKFQFKNLKQIKKLRRKKK